MVAKLQEWRFSPKNAEIRPFRSIVGYFLISKSGYRQNPPARLEARIDKSNFKQKYSQISSKSSQIF